jgi:hypothetical protein
MAPIWHWTERRIEAHVLVAFLGYCLWVCLKKKAERSAPSLTPWQILDQLGRIALVEMWFELRDGRRMCLPRITQPEPAQAVLLEQLQWRLPPQPPPGFMPKTCHPRDRPSRRGRGPPESVWLTCALRRAQDPANQPTPCPPCGGRAAGASGGSTAFRCQGHLKPQPVGGHDSTVRCGAHRRK